MLWGDNFKNVIMRTFSTIIRTFAWRLIGEVMGVFM